MKLIINAKTPEKIAYMDNPPAEGGEIKYLTAEAFRQKFNCDYTEGVVAKQLSRQAAIESDFKDARAKAAYARLLHPLENLVICKMTNDVGYGLFTTEDIPMGTVLCLYAGEYDPETAEFVYSYEGINAARIGGVARFMQHQPISKENHKAYLMQGLEDYHLFAIQNNIPEEEAKVLLNDSDFLTRKRKEYKRKIEETEVFSGYDFEQYHFFNKELVDQVAKSNVFIESTKVAGVDVILIIASRDIKKNELIGFSYGLMYWQHPSIRKPPLLFTKMGQVILPEKNYTHKKNLKAEMKAHYDSEEEDDYSDDSDDSEEERQPIIDTHVSPVKRDNLNQSNEEVEKKLQHKTFSFFGGATTTTWKKYPELGLVGKYVKHQVRFFTMSADETAKAKAFTEQLQKDGFDAELKKAKDKPSVVVDLTTSMPKLNS